MRYIFASQSLYKKPKGSEEDVRKVKDVTDRLTDPKKFPASHKQKLAENKRERESKLTARSYQSFGSLNSIAQSNSSLSENVPKVYRRLSVAETQSSKNKKYHHRSNNLDFTGYTNGFRVPDDSQKSNLRRKSNSIQWFSASSRTQSLQKIDSSKDVQDPKPKTLFDDVLIRPAAPVVSKNILKTDVTESRKVPIYYE